MRDELRALRKDSVKPISKMRKGDISAELERLRGMRETTPKSAAVPSAPPRAMKAKAGTVKESKAKEHPVAPAEAPKKKSGGTKAALMKMLAEMSDSEDE